MSKLRAWLAVLPCMYGLAWEVPMQSGRRHQLLKPPLSPGRLTEVRTPEVATRSWRLVGRLTLGMAVAD